jgi:hypothetical protein
MKKNVLLTFVFMCVSACVLAQSDVATTPQQTGQQLIDLLAKADGQNMKILPVDIYEANPFISWIAIYDSKRKAISFSNEGKSIITSSIEVGPNFLLMNQLMDSYLEVLAKSQSPEIALLRPAIERLQAITKIEQNENILNFYKGEELIFKTMMSAGK